MGDCHTILARKGLPEGMCRTANNGCFDTTFLTENDHGNGEGELISLHGQINIVEILDILVFYASYISTACHTFSNTMDTFFRFCCASL
ncbi:MAG: hypothetical protein HW406_331 [Candidatus Brocadiaceae bacterium]|nr:hypothetical protein [Candidatus Brocadiaceae bacterium]